MKRRIAALLFGLLILITAYFFSLQSSRALPIDRLVIADAQQVGFGLLYIADKKGYFTEVGLDVHYNKFTLGKDALDSVLEETSNLATVYETPLVRRIYEGNPLSIITSLHRSNNNAALIASKHRGITSALDLKGKRVAVTKGINTEIFLYILLLTHGVPQNDVKIVDMTTDQMIEAFKLQTIDAIVTFNPYIYRVTNAHNPQDITVLYADTYTEISFLAGNHDFIVSNPRVIRKLIQALLKAEEFYKTKPQESLAIVHDWIPQYTDQEIRATWDSHKLSLRLDNTILTILNREAQFLQHAGEFTTDIPQFTKSIITTYLKEAKPEEVLIY